MKKVFMMVYNDIAKDARVQRAARALAQDYELTLYAVGQWNEENIRFIPVKNCVRIGGVKAQLRFVLGAVTECLKRKPDIVYAHDIFSAVPMMLLRWLRKRAKYIYDAHELFLPEEHKGCSRIDALQYWFEGRAIRSAQLVICAQQKRAQIMAERYALKEPPVVIRNVSYLPEKERLKTEEGFWKIPAFAVVYAGGMLPGRKLDALIDAVAALGSGYKLMLIGDGPDYKRLENKVLAYNTENIRIRPGVPYAELGAWLSAFDAGYLFYPVDTANNLYCAPNKIYEYAGVGLPIIANENPTVAEELARYKIGICEDDIAAAIEKVRAMREEICGNMKSFVRENTLESELERLRGAVKGL